MGQIEIGRVTARDVELRGPETAIVSWDVLRAAATQEDEECRTAYADALRHAEAIRKIQINDEINAAERLVVCYGRDESHVWYHTWVETETGHYVGRTWRTMSLYAQAEGGTYAQAWMAESEAKDVATRIRAIAGGACGPVESAARIERR